MRAGTASYQHPGLGASSVSSAGVVEQRLERIEPFAEALGVSRVVDGEQALP
jgi:hypothetical protein